MADGTNAKPALDLSVRGTTGLAQYGGYVFDEWDRALQGARGRRIFREMADNDPIIGAILFSLEMLIRKVTWKIIPGADPKAFDLISSAFGDMDRTWEDTLSEILTFLPEGFSVHEILYKRRLGGDTSKFSDGLIGWAGWPMRGQETVQRWLFDPYGNATAMVQLGPPDFETHVLPLEKCLHFRTTTRRNNPEGRALDPQTPIPTPHGWRVMDDLLPGDSVFDDLGNVRYVTNRADWENRPCYEVTFSDGSSIIADENHQWVTQTARERYGKQGGQVRTTADIADSVKASTDTSNHSIAWAGALDYPTQYLPLDPYVLGLWLGDGNARTAAITAHVDDAEETAARIDAAGYTTTIIQNGPQTSNGRLIRVAGTTKWASDGPVVALRVLGLIQNKHIPAAYLRGTVKQRLALLAGLMDSDGHVDAWGRCEFINTNPLLIEGVAELVRSLGCGCTVTPRHRAGEGKHVRDSYAVRFTPDCLNPFCLARKRAKVTDTHARRRHYIVSVEPVTPRRTVCIEVDSPSHLFLAGTSMVPTHNSILRNVFTTWHQKKHIEAIEGVGIERDLAGLPVAYVPSEILAEDAPDDLKRTKTMIENIVTNIRRDEQEGVLWPLEYHDEHPLPLYELKLLTTGGQRQFNTDAIISRKDQRMTMAVMADFLTLGHERVGSNAMAQEKGRLFTAAISGWLAAIAGIVNEQGIRRLLRLNGFATDDPPRFVHGEVDRPDLMMLGQYMLNLASAGLPIDYTPGSDLLKQLMEAANLPDPPDHVTFPVTALQNAGQETQTPDGTYDSEGGPTHPAGPSTPAGPAKPGGPAKPTPRRNKPNKPADTTTDPNAKAESV